MDIMLHQHDKERFCFFWWSLGEQGARDQVGWVVASISLILPLSLSGVEVVCAESKNPSWRYVCSIRKESILIWMPVSFKTEIAWTGIEKKQAVSNAVKSNIFDELNFIQSILHSIPFNPNSVWNIWWFSNKSISCPHCVHFLVKSRSRILIVKY